MVDPYKILGVSKNDSDEEIKSAYRKLAKKYHPDNYDSSPLSDLAAEKMKEINEAYDTIMNQRRHKSSKSNFYGDRHYSSEYSDIRRMIMNGRLDDAEQILNGVPSDRRSAEWYFLKGSIMYKKGWIEEAFYNFDMACRINPGNQEYRAAMNKMYNQRSGNYGGFNPSEAYTARGCSSCDVCTSLICADCCCECMGGDFIRCC